MMKFRIEETNQRGAEYPVWIAICQAAGAKTYVEVGCGVGGGCNYIRSVGMEKIVGVDLCPHRPAIWGERRPGDEGNMGYVSGDSSSEEVVNRTIEFLGGAPPDAVFIDADHNYEKSKKDFERWWPHTRFILGFHDILMDPRNTIAKFWGEIRLVHRSLELYSRDLKSVLEWQGQGCLNAAPDGNITAGGIGILFKE